MISIVKLNYTLSTEHGGAAGSHVVICGFRITPSARERFVRAEDYRRDIHWSLRHIAEIYLMFNHHHFFHIHSSLLFTNHSVSRFLALSIYIKNTRDLGMASVMGIAEQFRPCPGATLSCWQRC